MGRATLTANFALLILCEAKSLTIRNVFHEFFIQLSIPEMREKEQSAWWQAVIEQCSLSKEEDLQDIINASCDKNTIRVNNSLAVTRLSLQYVTDLRAKGRGI